VADSAIFVGVTIFLLLQVFEGDKQEKNLAEGELT
jgi:lipoprotein signal peptidase